MIIDGNNISVDITVCLNELLDMNSDMIPDSNNISVESYCVCEWTAG